MTNFGPNRSGAASGTGVPTGAVPESLFTAKGDLVVGTGVGTEIKLAVGADNTRFVPDSTQATGLKYAADNLPAAVGTDGYLLHAQSGAATKLQYLPPSQGFSLINGYLDWTVAASALTVAIKGWDGNDPSATNPVFAVLRDVTSTTGLPVLVKITAANSVVVSSGSTLGTRNGIACRVWAVLFNDAGTYRIGVINCLTTVAGVSTGSEVTAIYPLAGWGIASSTAEGGAGAADSAQIFYTGTAVTSKAYTVLGYVTFESGQTTAGTWAAAASRKQLWGPAVPLPGAVIQTARNSDGARVSIATAIPYDDTIPQNNEGVQVMTQAITPVSAANPLIIAHSGLYSSEVATDLISVALFQDAVAGSLAAIFGSQSSGAGGSSSQPTIEYWLLAATTSSTTFKIRAGPTGANASSFNGTGGARKFGGVAYSTLTVQEIMG